MFKEKKAQTAGLITGLIFGIASLVIAIIISFIIVSTLTNANLVNAGRPTIVVSNEGGAGINLTGYTLASVGADRLLSGSFVIVNAYGNASDYTINSTNIDAGNYSLDTTTGIITNGTSDMSWIDVVFNYTYVERTHEEITTDGLSTNFTAGIDNVSGKIPTVLLVAAIVLILSVLVLLVGAWQRMRIGGGSI